MKRFNKTLRFFFSMRFAIILLVLLAVYCSIGSLVTQGQTYEWYAAAYSERRAALLMALHLDDAFHSPFFVVITAFLCLNLLMCNVIRLPQLIRRFKGEKDPAEAWKTPATATVNKVTAPEAVFEKLRMGKPVPAEIDGKKALFASKNRIGLFGAWVCHLGVLLLILGFGLGQMTKQEYAVYGVPGQTRMIGDTGLALTIDDFDVALREDDTVEQYTAYITVRDLNRAGVPAESTSISVNNPSSLFGMKFYQNSTGWAANVTISKNGDPLQEEVLCAGEFVPVEDKPELVIYFNAFYPDYRMTDSGPVTVSGQLNNPAYLYSVYYDSQVIGMNVLLPGEEITIDEYTVAFDEPQNYTVIQVKKDSFTWLAFVGGIVTMIGLVLAFYLLPARLLAVQEEEGWTIRGISLKGGALFRERLAEACGMPAEEMENSEA